MNDAKTSVNEQIFWGWVRTLIAAAAGYLVSEGRIDESTAIAATGVLMFLLPVAWSAWAKHDSERATQKRERTAVQAGALEARTGDLDGVPVEAIGPNHAQDIITKLQEKSP